jgi:hypothetical protein
VSAATQPTVSRMLGRSRRAGGVDAAWRCTGAGVGGITLAA